MVTFEDIKKLKQMLEELEILEFEYRDNDEYDYEDIKKRIYNLQDEIKCITNYWEI